MSDVANFGTKKHLLLPRTRLQYKFQSLLFHNKDKKRQWSGEKFDKGIYRVQSRNCHESLKLNKMNK